MAKPLGINAIVTLDLAISALVAFAGSALSYWAESLARTINAWSVDFYRKIPAMKRLPGSGNAGTELNYKSMLICFSICGALLLVLGAVGFLEGINLFHPLPFLPKP